MIPSRLKNVFTLFSGNALGILIPIIFSPLLTRLYQPEDFGNFILFVSLIEIGTILATGRYELSILLPTKSSDALNLLTSILLLVTLVCSILFLFSVLIVDLGFFDENRFDEIIYLTALGVLVNSISLILNYWNTRNSSFKIIASGKVIKGVTGTLFQMVFGYLFLSIPGLIIGRILGDFANMIFQYFKNYKELSFKSYSLESGRSLLHQHIKFPKFSASTGLLNILSSKLPDLLLNFWFNPIYAGFYGLSARIINQPLNLVSSAFQQVFYKEIVDIHKLNSSKTVYQHAVRTAKFLFSLSVLPGILVILFGPELFMIVFGDEWVTSGIYAQWLMPWLMMVFVKSSISSIINVSGHLKQNMIIQGCLLFLRFMALYIGYYYQDALLAIQIFGISGFAFNVFHLGWILKISKRMENL